MITGLEAEQKKADELFAQIRHKMKNDHENKYRPFGFDLPQDILIVNDKTEEEELFRVEFPVDTEILRCSDGFVHLASQTIVNDLTGERSTLAFVNAGWALECPLDDTLKWRKWRFVVRPARLAESDAYRVERELKRLREEQQSFSSETSEDIEDEEEQELQDKVIDLTVDDTPVVQEPKRFRFQYYQDEEGFFYPVMIGAMKKQ
jgi:hypothetical protein